MLYHGSTDGLFHSVDKIFQLWTTTLLHAISLKKIKAAKFTMRDVNSQKH